MTSHLRQDSYNLVVIGAGSGGLVSAAGAAGVGAKVAIIEENLMGGDCLNTGCVPSKALLSVANRIHALKTCKEYGITINGKIEIDFGEIMTRSELFLTSVIDAQHASFAFTDCPCRFRGTILQCTRVLSAIFFSDSEALGVDVFLGRGVFVGKHSISVNGKLLKFAKCVIATGGRPAIPKIPGLKPDSPILTR